jgi:uncharacterized membrane protein YqjE
LDANGPGRIGGDVSGDEKPIGDIVNRISENASLLIREEIELAKAEVEEKVSKLAQGAVVGGIAGFFVLIGLIFLVETIAWALVDVFNWDGIWPGFLVVTIGLFLLAALGGFIAYRAFKSGAPPTPDQAIEEAKLIREAIEHPEVQAAISSSSSSAQRSD